MVEQSIFSKLPKNQLVFICEQLINGDFEVFHPYDDYYDSYEVLEKAAEYFGMSVVDEDLQFFAKLIQLNAKLLDNIFETKDKKLYNQLIIPVAKNYKLHYYQKGSCLFRERYETTWACYDEKWVIDSASQMRDDGNWDLSEGELMDTVYDDYEYHDWDFLSTEEMNDNISESKLKNSIIESLNKKTLLELRGLIDSRLRTL